MKYKSLTSGATKTAKIVAFDLEKIKGLRKDFLDLTRAIAKADSFEEAERLMGAASIWRKNFDDFVEALLKELDAKGLQGHASSIRIDAWDVSQTMGHPPLVRSRRRNWGPDAMYQDFQDNVSTWFRKIRRHARDLWKRMETAATRGIEIQVYLEDDYQMEMEGFRILIRGYREDSGIKQKLIRERMGVLAPGLRAYRSRASQVFPILIEKQIPIIARMDGGLNELAAYKKDGQRRIEVKVNKLDKDIKGFVHLMAHEMAHHVYQTHLSGAQTDFWNQVVRAHKTKLDIRDVLSRWPASLSRSDFDDLIKEQDPELYIQLESLHTSYPNRFLLYREHFEELVAEGESHLVVNTGLPTGYSSKNPQEAFCEVVGRLVAYGPKAVPDAGVQWIKTILPQIKVSHHIKRNNRRSTVTDLRDQLIRLAYKKPEMRDDLIALIKEAGTVEASHDQNLRVIEIALANIRHSIRHIEDDPIDKMRHQRDLRSWISDAIKELEYIRNNYGS